MFELLSFIGYLIALYRWVVIANVVMSWLIGLGIINTYNPMVRSVWQGISAVTEPLLRPIRNMLPATGGLDFSPIVLLIACVGLEDFFIPFLQRTLA